MMNKRFRIQVGNAFQPQEGTVQRRVKKVTNHLGHHDSQHYQQQGLDIIRDLYLRRRENKGLSFLFFLSYS